jgi:hypothetical protein
MDLREMIQRRLGKKESSTNTNTRKPDPPSTDGNGNNDNNNKSNDKILKKAPTTTKPQPQQPIELGTISYCNITDDGRHGDYKVVLEVAKQSDKPIFANFVEWSG